MKIINDGTDRRELNLSPKYGICNDVRPENYSTRKIVWLVPHVVKHSMNQEIIIWRCNWGNVCKSACIYAMAKEENKRITSKTEIQQNTDLIPTCSIKNDTGDKIIKVR